jgi:hypothetical protein
VNPRKSSTSSGKPPFERPRYLGLEVVGEPFPPLSPARWEAFLRGLLERPGSAEVRFRLIRSEGRRAVVAVGHRELARARAAWNPAPGDRSGLGLVTRRTWGTLVQAKAWLRSSGPGVAPGRRGLPDPSGPSLSPGGPRTSPP